MLQPPQNYIPQYPFSELVFNNYEISGPGTPDNIQSRLVCGMQFGSLVGEGAGLSGSGLFPILNAMFAWNAISNYSTFAGDILPTSKFTINKDFFRVTSLGSRNVFVIRDLTTLLSNLDNLHNNIASIIYHFDPSNPRYDTNGGPIFYSYNNVGRIFDAFINYYFPGSYINKQDVENPKNGNATRGNGITKAFVIYDQGSSKWQLSRAGVELATLINYLSYGGIAVVAPTWRSLSGFNPNTNSVVSDLNNIFYDSVLTGEGDINLLDFVGPLDCIITLDMNGGIERRQLGTGPNRNVYGALPETYGTGNSFGFAYGLTASQLINEFAANGNRSTFLNTIYGFNSTSSVLYKDIPVIHSALSGSDISLEQNTLTTDLTFDDVSRYGGLNGEESLIPLSTTSTSGLTAYTLTTSDLEKTMCVIGKKHKICNSIYFGDPNNGNRLDMVTPLVGDVAGLLAKNKENTQIGLYGPPIGPVNGKILNASFIEPSIDPNVKNSVANKLRGKKINFVYEDINQGYFLATELVGATVGTSGTIDANSRFGIAWLKRALRRDIESKLNALIGGGDFINNSSNRIIARQSVIEIVDGYRNPYLDPDHTPVVQCDGNNNNDGSPTLTVAVTIKPKSVVYDYQGPNPAQSVTTLNITINALGAAYGNR